VFADVPITVVQNSEGAIAHAMKKRCDFPPNVTDPATFVEGHNIIMSKIHTREKFRVDGEMIKAYLAKCRPGKAAALLAALGEEEYTLDGMNAQKHVFAKQETLLKEHGAQPRVVYQGTDMYNAVVGAVIDKLQSRMQEEFSLQNPKNTGNVIIYAPGMASADLGDIISDAEGTPIESDMKNNDASQSGAWRKHEAMFYSKLGAPDWFVRHFAKQTKVRVWTRVGIEATVEGQRWSGEGTTTTGNSYVGACVLQAGLKAARVEKSTNVHGGDDYLGFVVEKSTDVVEAIVETAKKCGMQAEAFKPKSRDHATFYRKRFPNSPRAGCRPVPQFGRVLAKLNVRANQNTEVCDREYMAGKYLSAAYDHRNAPEIAQILLQTSEAMSDRPYLDKNNTSHGLDAVKTPEGIRKTLEHTIGHDAGTLTDFCHSIYGHSYTDVIDLYRQVASSALDYLDGWTVIGKKGMWVNRENNWKYEYKKLNGQLVTSLREADL